MWQPPLEVGTLRAARLASTTAGSVEGTRFWAAVSALDHTMSRGSGWCGSGGAGWGG